MTSAQKQRWKIARRLGTFNADFESFISEVKNKKNKKDLWQILQQQDI
jgi:hypothetical protein